MSEQALAALFIGLIAAIIVVVSNRDRNNSGDGGWKDG